MANYININGRAVGPIQLGNDGTWLCDKILAVGPDNKKIKHLNFSLSLNKDELIVARAKTPLMGTYKDDEGKLQPQCDPQSLATIEWVMAYSSLAPGDRVIDLSIYVTKSYLENWKLNIENSAINNEKKIEEINKQLGVMSNKINSLSQGMNKLPDNLLIVCGRATPNFKI